MGESGHNSETSSGSHGAFDLLAPGIQEQLYRMKWGLLRPIQVDAIRAYAEPGSHLLIMAETAGGKTEAAFLPILSSISAEPIGSIRAMYVGPLKALINDQFGRLEELCSYIEMPVTKWHGDASDGKKKAILKSPGGVLLITPESLESMLINRTAMLQDLFGGLRAIVIDELHSFLDSERGLHLASLLSRLRRFRLESEPEWRMVGLSATIGDIDVARRYLSRDDADRVVVVTSPSEHKEIRISLRGYNAADFKTVERSDSDEAKEDERQHDETELGVMRKIAGDLVDHCVGEANLVFANRKANIELYADLANEICRAEGSAETFVVHHGSLAKEVREDTELRMKSGQKLTTMCSSTLEMGIDIGSVHTVGQIDAPFSVASLKQRMGRSGRRDSEPRRLRMYIEYGEEGKDALSRLPLDLLQAIATVELMISKWVEPPAPAKRDFSTLTQQTISVTAEFGEISASDLYAVLCDSGPFRSLDKKLFGALLRQLRSEDVVEISNEQRVILGLEGERIRSKYDFYAAFATPVEYEVIAGDRPIGSLPVGVLTKPGQHVVLAAKRWEVVDIDDKKRVLYVRPTRKRKAPGFDGTAGEVHPRVREEMRRLLTTDSDVRYLNDSARSALERARKLARENGLAKRALLPIGEGQTLWMTWTGTRAQQTLSAMLEIMGIGGPSKDTTVTDVSIACKMPPDELHQRLADAEKILQDDRELAGRVGFSKNRKYDHLLNDEILLEAARVDGLDATTAREVVRETRKK